MGSFAIARIETFVFRVPVAEPVVTSFFAIPDRVSVIIRVEDTDGAHGWGELWCNFPSCGAEHRGLVLHRTVAPMALGRAVDDPAALWRELAMRSHAWAVQSGVTAQGLTRIAPWVAVAAGGVIYLLALVATGGVGATERRLALRLLGRGVS